MLNLNIFFNYNKAFKLEINKIFWYKTINAKFKKKKKIVNYYKAFKVENHTQIEKRKNTLPANCLYYYFIKSICSIS